MWTLVVRETMLGLIATLGLISQAYADDSSIPPGWSLSPEYQQYQKEQQQKNAIQGDRNPLPQATAHEIPTLLETWFFIVNGYEVTYLGTKAYGRAVTREFSRLVEDIQKIVLSKRGVNYRETWTKDNCIINRQFENLDDPTENSSKQFFLNNILPNFEIRTKQYETVQKIEIRLLAGPNNSGANKAITCDFDANGNLVKGYDRRDNDRAFDACWSSFNITVNSLEDQNRVQRALNYIYSNFCTYAKYKKPF